MLLRPRDERVTAQVGEGDQGDDERWRLLCDVTCLATASGVKDGSSMYLDSFLRTPADIASLLNSTNRFTKPDSDITFFAVSQSVFSWKNEQETGVQI